MLRSPSPARIPAEARESRRTSSPDLGAVCAAFVVGFPGTMTAVVLTIAGSDSSGGAGIQADLKTFAAFAVFGTSAITAVTAQNTLRVSAIANLDTAFVAAQIDAVADDFTIAAAKTGMLSRTEIIGAVADRIRIRKIPNVVVDPVMVAASGDALLEPDAITMMRDVMLPLAAVVTPNLREASILTGRDVSNRDAIREAAQALVALGARGAGKRREPRCRRARRRRPKSGCNRHSLRRPQFPRI